MKILASNGESLHTGSYRYMCVSLYGEWWGWYLGKEGRPLSGKQSMEEKGERNQECPTHIMQIPY